MSSGRVAEVLEYPLDCGHAVRWSVPPHAGDVVWCVRCDAPARVPGRGAVRSHGYAGYAAGCRCAVCVATMREYWRRHADGQRPNRLRRALARKAADPR
jgi:hypothetical protein